MAGHEHEAQEIVNMWVLYLFGDNVEDRMGPAYEGVAWWAHVGGFVAGLVLLPVFKNPPKKYRRYYTDEYRPR